MICDQFLIYNAEGEGNNKKGNDNEKRRRRQKKDEQDDGKKKHNKTRKLCYRKDDRVMRPIRVPLKLFTESD